MIEIFDPRDGRALKRTRSLWYAKFLCWLIPALDYDFGL